ncbi:MAG: 2-phospho-L-lactate transferase [bacterium]
MAHYLAISGGIGGAKLALGLSEILAPDELTVAINIGDDFELHGLPISPDIDTTLYTLAGLNDLEKGWGRRDETWEFHHTLQSLGREPWFQLGDKDLALHVARQQLLSDGLTLSGAIEELAQSLGVHHRVLPMSDDPVRTVVHTDQGVLPFQHYFVEYRAEPTVQKISFDGAEEAEPSPALAAVFARSDLAGVIICPSNPYLSIDPLLAIPGMVALLDQTQAPVVAVSPIVGGRAIKGPTAKIMSELGREVTAATVAQHYLPWLDGFILDERDSDLIESIEALGLAVTTAQTVMQSLDDKVSLAKQTLDWLATLSGAAG